MTMEETKDLWRCMLELQDRYGCYNSRRIDTAMGADYKDALKLMRKLTPLYVVCLLIH